MNVLFAILLKDWRVAYYSKGIIFYQVLSVVFYSAMFMGISNFVTPDSTGSYVRFVLPALGAMEIMTHCLFAARNFLEREIQAGTLEQIATAHPSLLKVTLYQSLWPATKGLFDLALYLIILWLFEYNGSAVAAGTIPKLPLAIFGFFLLVSQFWFLGLIAAGVFLITRRGGSIGSILVLSATLLSGVYFPVNKLPSWFASLGQLSALSLFNDILRGHGTWGMFTPVFVCTVVLGILCVSAFKGCLQVARRRGTLVY